MNTDVLGKIQEKKLPFRNTLLPLFEAVVNSIHAIEDLTKINPNHKGSIEITVIRSTQKQIEEGKTELNPIIDFYIKDNGIGFNKENYESFNYTNSTYKAQRGGKGLGRFTWLRAYSIVDIESFYIEDEKWMHKTFKFKPTKDGVELTQNEPIITGTDNLSRYTEVKLKGLSEEYQKWCNLAIDSIAQKLIEHCFSYFLSPNCPILKIIDNKNICIVNDLFKESTREHIKPYKFKIRQEDFTLYLVKLYSSRIDNKIHYCANSREVQSDSIANDIPEIRGHFTDEDNDKYSISAYVTGKYFDTKVNNERTEISFDIQDVEDSLFPSNNLITKNDIKTEVLSQIRSKFKEIIEQINNERETCIQEFIEDHPRYRYLLKYKKEDLKSISSRLSKDKLELELFKIQQKLDLEVRIESKDMLTSLDKLEDVSSFKEKYKDIYEKIVEVGNSKLSEYVVHRKLILDILETHLRQDARGKYRKEDAIHQLIFPLKAETDEVGFDDHNLWVIDERLAFHKYLASDKSFKKNKEVYSESLLRPDIIIFNKPFAFSNNDKPYSSIVIIEFKRPMRDDYSDVENPINQVNNYVREIQNNLTTDKNGKQFDLRSGTPIYAYVVCDLTKKLREFAENAGYTKMPDNDGYFFFNNNFNLSIEIISFDKLIKDSKQRNKALFEKLNLPT